MKRQAAGCLIALVAWGMINASPAAARAQENSGEIPADARPMPAKPVPESMADLLRDGYDIVTFSAGLGGFGYLLRKDRAWVMCTVNVYGDASEMKPYSNCDRLNP